MAPGTLKKLTTSTWPVIVLALLLLASLEFMSGATQNSARFSELYSILLVVNALGLIALAGLIGWNLVRLTSQVRRRVAGARLRLRMVTMIVVLAVTPVLVVYYFSLQFLHRGIDSWFDVRAEQALDDALELGRTALGIRMREVLRQTELMATDIGATPPERTAAGLDDARRLSGASELTLMSTKGRVIASSSEDPMSIVPNRPDDTIMLQLRRSQDYIGLDPIGDSGLHVRVVVSVRDSLASGEPRVLQGLYPVPERMSALADTVQSAYAKYRELVYMREPLKTSFTLTLSLVLALSLLTAVWAAFSSARRLVAPLRNLVQGTQAVAEGDYELRLPEAGDDELGFLVASFNDMTRKLARARDETRLSQQELYDQRTYLEAVHARLSSGVMTLDQEQRLFTPNEAARHILGADLGLEVGNTLDEISLKHPHLRALTDALKPHLGDRDSEGDWREEVTLFGASGRQVLMCRGTLLPGSDNRLPGHVIVFDDVTALIQAQRNAAWSEVARRLAHEIKNPLTPIQLSAERLRRKYMASMHTQEQETFDRLTRTIVQQVAAMKDMVDAFSDYARSPRMQPRRLNLNELISDTLEMYRSETIGRRIRTRLDAALPVMEADPERLRQVLHNLTKNALEAKQGSDGGELTIQTRLVDESAGKAIEVAFRDRGGGFPADIIEHVFEPYVTTKPKGSGLGLAIVQKIVEEHGGVVWAKNNRRGGANVIMRFPVTAAVSVDESDPAVRRKAV